MASKVLVFLGSIGLISGDKEGFWASGVSLSMLVQREG